MRITLKDIAEQAGVSKALVSMYLNHDRRARLTDEKRKRIDQLVAETGYRPSHAARVLRQGRSKTIGMVLGGLSDPFFHHLAEQVLKYSSQQNYQILLALTEWDCRKEKQALQLLLDRGVDAVILTADIANDPDDFARIIGNRPGIIFRRTHPSYSSVVVDMRAIFHEIAAHFQSLGITEITLIDSDRQNLSVFQEAAQKEKIRITVPDITCRADDNEALSDYALEACRKTEGLYIASCWTVKRLLEKIYTENTVLHPKIVTNYNFPEDFIDDPHVTGIIDNRFSKFVRTLTDTIIDLAEHPQGPVVKTVDIRFYTRQEFIAAHPSDGRKINHITIGKEFYEKKT